MTTSRLIDMTPFTSRGKGFEQGGKRLALRRELDGSGISVSYVAPRATRTDLNSRAVVEMNTALGTAMDDPALVADAVMSTIRASRRSDKYLGWPEKLFVRVNALFPRLVDNSLRKQLPIIRRFAADKA